MEREDGDLVGATSLSLVAEGWWQPKWIGGDTLCVREIAMRPSIAYHQRWFGGFCGMFLARGVGLVVELRNVNAMVYMLRAGAVQMCFKFVVGLKFSLLSCCTNRIKRI